MIENLLLASLFMSALPIMILTSTYGDKTMTYPGWHQEPNVIPIQQKALAWQDHVDTALHLPEPVTASYTLLPGPGPAWDDLVPPPAPEPPYRPTWTLVTLLAVLTYAAGFMVGYL